MSIHSTLLDLDVASLIIEHSERYLNVSSLSTVCCQQSGCQMDIETTLCLVAEILCKIQGFVWGKTIIIRNSG